MQDLESRKPTLLSEAYSSSLACERESCKRREEEEEEAEEEEEE